MTEKLGKFVVVEGNFSHHGYNDEALAVARALTYNCGRNPARLLHVVQEIDLSQWELCPACGRAVEKAIGCWDEECVAYTETQAQLRQARLEGLQ